MAVDTKQNLYCGKFEQCIDDILNLSGCTQLFGTFDVQPNGIIDSCSGYRVSGVTIFNTGDYVSALKIGQNSISTQVNDIAIGASSCATGAAGAIAIGYNSKATGNTSTALGANSCATNTNTIAIGGYSKATGNASTALGVNSCSTGYASTALGANSCAININTIAIGGYSKATGNASTALGGNSCATGNASIALGYNSCAINTNTIAIGGYSKATGNASTALGGNSCATGNASIAIGANSESKSNSSISIGSFAGYNNSIGACNIFIGECAGYYATGGTGNVFIGHKAGAQQTIGDNKLYIHNDNSVNPLIGGDFSARCVVINGTLKLSGVTAGACTDKILTWDSSTCTVRQIAYTSGGSSPSGTVSGEKISKYISQNSHGFNVGDVVGWSGGTYNKAIANGLYDGEVLGLVTKCINANCFELTQAGYVTGLTSLSTNTTYFLSPTTAGAITSVEPTIAGQISKSVLVADSTTSGWVLPYAGYIVTTGTTGGGSSVCEFTICGDGTATGFTVQHNINKQFVMSEVVQAASPYGTVYTTVQRPNANCVCIKFDTAPPNGVCYKVLISG